MGLASRREAETWIAEGRVAVNGVVVDKPGKVIDPSADQVTVDGKPVSSTPPPRVYWLLNKPDQCLSVRGDTFQRGSIFNLPSLSKVKFAVQPIGRLDFRTEGLLVLTNDGDFINGLAKSGAAFPRRYHVLLSRRLSDDEMTVIQRGKLSLEDGPVGKAELRFAHGENLGSSRGGWYVLTLNESRNRLVRRMFEHFGCRVVRLIRVGFAGLELTEDLAAGDYRQLTGNEIVALRRVAGLSRTSIAEEEES